ncbi:MAG: hypothetical protein ACLQLC_03805 [Candidatus Sulfotelmatobacter sp.]
MEQQTEIRNNLPPGIAFEKHYFVKDIAALWGFSNDAVRRIFENEPGVIRIGRPEGLHRRKYFSIRIPESVMRRVHQKITRPLGRVI